MDGIENNYNEEDEISLIDLFAVLIRFRKLIVIGTVLVTFLAGLYLFVLPKLIPSLDKRDLSVSYTINIQKFPKTIENGLGNLGIIFDFNSYLEKKFSDYSLLASEYKKFPFMGDDYPSEKHEYNQFIKSLVTTKKIALVDSKTKNIDTSFQLDCVVPEKNYEVLNSFLSDFLNTLNADIKKTSDPYISELERKSTLSYKEASSSSSSSSSSTLSDTVQMLRETLQDIELYKRSPVSFYSVNDEPFTVGVAQGRVKKLVIICFAAFFIFVFIAFAKNAVINIKEDPEASKTLKLAWESGK